MKTQTLTVKLDMSTSSSLNNFSREVKKSKSVIVRDALFDYMQKRARPVGQSLRSLTHIAKKSDYQAPPDILANINKYLYESPE